MLFRNLVSVSLLASILSFPAYGQSTDRSFSENIPTAEVQALAPEGALPSNVKYWKGELVITKNEVGPGVGLLVVSRERPETRYKLGVAATVPTYLHLQMSADRVELLRVALPKKNNEMHDGTDAVVDFSSRASLNGKGKYDLGAKVHGDLIFRGSNYSVGGGAVLDGYCTDQLSSDRKNVTFGGVGAEMIGQANLKNINVLGQLMAARAFDAGADAKSHLQGSIQIDKEIFESESGGTLSPFADCSADIFAGAGSVMRCNMGVMGTF